MKVIAIAVVALALAGCNNDAAKNDEPRYGKESGLPTNCRALIQANINGFRSGTYTPQEAFASIERNCGAYGALWE